MATKNPSPAQAQQLHREGKISLAQRNMAYAKAQPPSNQPVLAPAPAQGKRNGRSGKP
jgi:hypothetical protein